MRERLIQFACVAVLLIFAAFWLSVGSAFQWNAEADGVLRSNLNATPIIETNHGVSVEEYKRARAPVLNPGKPILPCPECANYTLTDYRRSPTVFGPNGLYKGHFEGDEFIPDRSFSGAFSKTPVR